MPLPRHLTLLNVKQPWATAIATLGKDVENRSNAIKASVVSTEDDPYWVLILASQNKVTRADLVDLESRTGAPSPLAAKEYASGSIVAAVKFSGSSKSSSSPWHNRGDHAWNIDEVVDLQQRQSRPISGFQGLFVNVDKSKDRVRIYAAVRRGVPANVWREMVLQL